MFGLQSTLRTRARARAETIVSSVFHSLEVSTGVAVSLLHTPQLRRLAHASHDGQTGALSPRIPEGQRFSEQLADYTPPPLGRRPQDSRQVEEGVLVKVAVPLLSGAQVEEVGAVRAHLAVETDLEEEDRVGGVAVVAAAVFVAAPTRAVAEAGRVPKVELVGRVREDDAAPSLPRQPPLRCAHLPLEVAADVVGHPPPEEREHVDRCLHALLGVARLGPSRVGAEPLYRLVEAEQRWRGVRKVGRLVGDAEVAGVTLVPVVVAVGARNRVGKVGVCVLPLRVVVPLPLKAGPPQPLRWVPLVPRLGAPHRAKYEGRVLEQLLAQPAPLAILPAHRRHWRRRRRWSRRRWGWRRLRRCEAVELLSRCSAS
mmetsp:Transcript_2732/g.8224  ORF Transcript_2732/g.8224 Transcript_2732/m.8224 type:complete len:370 (+) Transcript_2732:42-1151(+)